MNAHSAKSPARKNQSIVYNALLAELATDDDFLTPYKSRFDTEHGFIDLLKNALAIYTTDYWKHIFVKSGVLGCPTFIRINDEWNVDIDTLYALFQDYMEKWNAETEKFEF